MKTLSRSAGIALLAIAVSVSSAGADTVKCQRAISKANSQFLQARVKALSKCQEAIVKSGVPGVCPDPKASTSISKAVTKMQSTIAKSCGGADKLCNGSGDDTLAAIGWPSQCPNFEKGSCNNAITDCGDIADCLACVGGAASDQAMSLYYGNIALQTADKTLNKCQVTIGKATSAYLNSASKALQKCEDARLTGKHGLNCFPPSVGDGKYQAALSKAETKKVNAICKACGGADKLCTGGDNLTPAAIGFATDCPLVTRPNGGTACGGTITDLSSLIACVDCVTAFKADCTDLLSVPQNGAYPAECNACTEPAPTGACPTTISFTADGTTVDLDSGFTGLAHNATVPTNGRITLAVSGCDGATFPTCGECDVNGPLDNAGGVAFDNHRCKDAPWVQCSADADCTSAKQCLLGSNNGALCNIDAECPGSTCVGGTNGGDACVVSSECPGGTCTAATCVNAGHAGPCIYFFGSPLPLRAGGVSTCILNEISGSVTGTININDGTSTTNVPLQSKVHPVGTEFAPCPRCEGGVCGDGPRVGQACSVNGTGIFGDVSLDCPPNPGSLAGALGINLNIATGTQTKTLSTANPNCRQTGYTGLKCFCETCNDLAQEACSTNGDCPMNFGGPGICGGRRCIGGTDAGKPCNTCIGGTNHGATCANASACPGGNCPTGCPGVCIGGSNDTAVCNSASTCPGGTCSNGQCNRPGEATQPNVCQDDTTNPGLDCMDAGNNEGACSIGPVDTVCSIQTFRSCSVPSDCDPDPMSCPECLPNQDCIVRFRPCFPDNGVVGGSVSVSGSPDVPCGGVSKPVVGTFFCVAPVGATAVNAAGGLPGLGRVRIPGVVLIDP